MVLGLKPRASRVLASVTITLARINPAAGFRMNVPVPHSIFGIKSHLYWSTGGSSERGLVKCEVPQPGVRWHFSSFPCGWGLSSAHHGGAGEGVSIHATRSGSVTVTVAVSVGVEGGRTVSGWCGREVRTYRSFLSVTQRQEKREEG